MTAASPSGAELPVVVVGTKDNGENNNTDRSTPTTPAADSDSTTSLSFSSSTAATEIVNKTSPSEDISREELTELVGAIKFAKPEASQRDVHREITQEIPTNFPHYAFLGHGNNMVQLNDVKKVWKKATQQQQQSSESTTTATTAATKTTTATTNADLIERLQQMQIPQMYTVGDATSGLVISGQPASSSSSSSIARDYVTAFLMQSASEQQQQDAEESVDAWSKLEDYVHVFLNVPLDTSGSRPHQALINFQKTTSPLPNKSEAYLPLVKPKRINPKKHKKQHGPRKGSSVVSVGSNTSTSSQPPPPFEDAIIVKIQMAAPLNEMDTVKHPMLLYDQSRQLKTAVHYHPPPPAKKSATTSPPPENHDSTETTTTKANYSTDDDGYIRVAQWIHTAGVGGALGQAGGTKAYFYSRLTKVDQKEQQATADILSIYIKELAPNQDW